MCPWQRVFFWLLRFADGANPFKLRPEASLAQLAEHAPRERMVVGLIPTRGFPREAPSSFLVRLVASRATKWTHWGLEPRASLMLSGCDTTAPCALPDLAAIC